MAKMTAAKKPRRARMTARKTAPKRYAPLPTMDFTAANKRLSYIAGRVGPIEVASWVVFPT